MKAFVLPRLSGLDRNVRSPRAISKEKSISHSLFIKHYEGIMKALRHFVLNVIPFTLWPFLFLSSFLFTKFSYRNYKKGLWKVEELQKMTEACFCLLPYWATMMLDKATEKHKLYVWNHLCPLYSALNRVCTILFYFWMYFCSDCIHNYLNDSNPVSVIVT